LKKVRRAAGRVRDFDVHSELLAENFLQTADAAHDATAEGLAKATAGASADPEATSLIDQASTLLAWLVDRRSEAADALCATLDGHRSRLSDAEKQFLAACTKRPPRMRGLGRTPARMALEDYLRLMDAMPLLDASNLHDFRKGAKKARYVAEAGGDDPAAVAMVKAIKRVQDAIGDWHDWEVLAEEAREALGSTGIALEEDIDGRVKHAYQRALRIANTVARRFVGEWQASRSRPSRAASRNSK
jgi:CHAD domain-containing protein